MRTDTELLSKLSDLTTGYGNGWICRISERCRGGLRIYETSREDAKKDLREAINDYLDKIEEKC